MPDALSPRTLCPFSRKETQLGFRRTESLVVPVVELQSKTIKDLYKQILYETKEEIRKTRYLNSLGNAQVSSFSALLEDC